VTDTASSGSNKVAAGIGLSRIAGVVREIFIAAVLGAGADAFRFAMQIPNLIQNLLGEGSLSAAFVPVYAGALQRAEEDPDGPDGREAQQLAGSVLGFGLAVVALLVAVVVLLTRPLVQVVTLGAVKADRLDLTVELTRITAVGVGVLVMAAWCLGVLNAHREYLLSYAAPVVWNLAQIAALAAALFLLDDEIPRASRWVAIAMVVGAVGQVMIQLPKLRSVAGDIRPSLKRTYLLSDVRERMVPAVAARGVVQLSSLLSVALTALLVAGGPSIMGYSIPLYILPISLFGFSVATAELTEMSRQSTDTAAVANRVRIGLRKVALAAGLCTAGLVFGGGAFAAALYEWPATLFGKDGLSADGAIATGLTLGAFGLALPAAMTARISQNALYAIGDVKGPARIALVRLVVLALTASLLMFQLDRLHVIGGEIVGDLGHTDFFSPVADRENPLGIHLGAVGIAMGSAIAAWVEWFLLRRRLNSALGQTLKSGIALGVTAAASVAGVTILAIRVLLELPTPLEAVVIGCAGVASFIATLRLLGYQPRKR
jgi:putative peptidoglycan lipid II flippase